MIMLDFTTISYQSIVILTADSNIKDAYIVQLNLN